MSEPMLELRVEVGLAADADTTELDEAARGLRSELLELDVQGVERMTDGTPPDGARGLDIAIGGLILTAAKEMITAVVRTAEHWASRGSNRSVKLTIGEDSLELSDVSDEDQRRLVEMFLSRHVAPLP